MRDALLAQDYLPQSQLVVPQHHIGEAKFPTIDAHVHLGNRRGRWAVEDVEALVDRMDQCNVKAIVNLDGGPGDLLKQNLERYRGPYPDRFAVLIHIGSGDEPLPGPVPSIREMPDGVICVRRGDDIVFVADYPAGAAKRHDLILDPAPDAKRVFLAGFPAGAEVTIGRGERSVSAKIPARRACAVTLDEETKH